MVDLDSYTSRRARRSNYFLTLLIILYPVNTVATTFILCECAKFGQHLLWQSFQTVAEVYNYNFNFYSSFFISITEIVELGGVV